MKRYEERKPVPFQRPEAKVKKRTEKSLNPNDFDVSINLGNETFKDG